MEAALASLALAADEVARVLYQAAVDLLEANDASHLLSASVRHAKRLLEADIAFVMLLDQASNALRLEASVGHRTPTFTTIVRPVRTGVVTANNKPVQTDDFLNDPRLDHHPPTDDLLRREGLRTILAIPLKSGGQMLGAIYVGNRSVGHLPAAAVDLLTRLARLVSAALARVNDLDKARAEHARVLQLATEADLERSLLRRVQHIRRQIAATAQDRQGISALCVAVGNALGSVVFVTDWNLSVIAAHEPGGFGSGRGYAGWLQRADGREALASCAASHRPARLASRWWVAAIESSNELFGYMAASIASGPAGDQLTELVLERMIDVAAVELAREGARQRHLHGDFVYELLSERSPDFAVLEARGPHVWGRYGGPHRPVVLKIDVEEEGWHTRLEAARRLVAAARPHDFSAVYGNRLIVLVGGATRADVAEAVAEIRDMLERNRLRTAAAVGSECRLLQETRASLLATLRLQELLDPDEVLWTDGLEALSLLFDPGQRDRLEAFARSALSTLESRPPLMDALEAYYESGNNKLAAARRLGVHVNTIRQRLERAEQLVGASIDESARALPLRLALLVRQVGARRAVAASVRT